MKRARLTEGRIASRILGIFLVSTAVVAMSMPDLNHATIRRRHRGNAQPGESGYAYR